MDKKEMIEKALLVLIGIADNAPLILHGYFSELVDALAEQIVIECEVEHTYDRADLYGTQFPMTILKASGFVFETLQGLHGTPGKALAIILPLEEESPGSD